MRAHNNVRMLSPFKSDELTSKTIVAKFSIRETTLDPLNY